MCLVRALVGIAAIAAAATPAHAQKAEAGAAFRRGRALMAKGEIDKACLEFEASMKLEAQSGTLYNLALCHEAAGKLASAWSELKELSETDNNASRAADAGRRAAALAPKLTKMHIVLTEPVDGLAIKRGDLDVTSLVGDDVPVDPGTYTFVANAPKYKEARFDVALSSPGATIEVTIPALVSEGGSDTTPEPEPEPGAWPDPGALSTTLRPLALPRRVWEVSAGALWGIVGTPAGGSTDPKDPVDTLVGARLGLGRVEVRALVDVHTRYEVDNSRPTIVRSITAGGTYVITPLFVIDALYRRYHPIGGDIDTGADYRVVAIRKHVVTPRVALFGGGGITFRDRSTRGSSPLSEFSLSGSGGVQLSPVAHVTFEATLALDLHLGGELYADTVDLDFGVGSTVAIDHRTDALAQLGLDVSPSSTARLLTIALARRF